MIKIACIANRPGGSFAQWSAHECAEPQQLSRASHHAIPSIKGQKYERDEERGIGEDGGIRKAALNHY